MMRILYTVIILMILNVVHAQSVPAVDENIPYLVTFSGEARKTYGDDDYSQTFFFSVNKSYKKPIYIRVYDPDVGGTIDESIGNFNSKTRFSLYGGKGCISEKDARSTEPIGNYKSGNLLSTKVFGNEEKYDGKWYTFGPFNPSEGEFSEKYGGYIFKVIADGLEGNDGNLYQYFLSSESDDNIPIEGGNAFTFEYTFRLHDDPKQISHIYPFVDASVISIKQSNFDWDDDGHILLTSVSTLNYKLNTSSDGRSANSEYTVTEKEKGTSLDFQFKKSPFRAIEKNNVVLYITNQYGEFLPFFTIPIGGVPKFEGKPTATPLDN